MAVIARVRSVNFTKDPTRRVSLRSGRLIGSQGSAKLGVGRSDQSQGGIGALQGRCNAGSGHGNLRSRSQSGHPSREDGLFSLRPSGCGGPDLGGGHGLGLGGHDEYGWNEAPQS
jgi:hypothetical protein